MVAALALAAQPMAAQARGVFRATPPSSGGSRGVEVRPAPQPTVIMPSSPSVFPRQPIAFVMIPAILMSDGTVLADFGMGYEPVTRSCGGTVVVSSEPTIIAGNGVVLSSPRAPTYTQPVPNQHTASQQMLQPQQRYPVLTSASQAACFSRDQAGRVFVVRQ